MKQGKIIVIEGVCDGVGKTTQINLLKSHLEKDGQEVVFHHFPSYNTYHGRLVEEYLKGTFGDTKDLSPYFITSLYAIDRIITWNTKLQKLYNEGKIILCDRYTTSSQSYQSAYIEDLEEKNKFIDYITDFEYNKLCLKKPDSIILLNVSFDIAIDLRKQRKNNEGIQNDLHERNLNFMKKAYDSSLYVAKYLNWNIINCSPNEELRTKEDIHEEIYESHIKKLML